jgi:hypothetical protein
MCGLNKAIALEIHTVYVAAAAVVADLGFSLFFAFSFLVVSFVPQLCVLLCVRVLRESLLIGNSLSPFSFFLNNSFFCRDSLRSLVTFAFKSERLHTQMSSNNSCVFPRFFSILPYFES